MWDSDVRPVGITGKYKSEGFFATGGVYEVFGADSPGNNAEALMVGAQAGVNLDTDNGGLVLAIGYQDYNTKAFEAANAELELDPADLLNSQAEFSLVDVFAKFHTEMDDTKLSVHGHWVQNLGADDQGGSQGARGLLAEDEDTAWVFGGKVKFGKIELGLDYAHIEADSVFAPIKDSDFGDTSGVSFTNIEGLKASAKYSFSKTLYLKGTLMDVEEIEKGNTTSEGDGELYQLDLVYKF